MSEHNIGLDKVAANQRDRLRQVIEDLEAYERSFGKPRDLEDDAFFFKTVKLAFELLDIVPADMQHGLHVSRTTISRWMNEECSPMPIGRPFVYDWLRKKSAKHRSHLRKRLRKLEVDHPAIAATGDAQKTRSAQPPSSGTPRSGEEKVATPRDTMREPH